MSSPSLITRLRRRTAMPWLLALLVLTKTVMATACITDGLSKVRISDGDSRTLVTAIATANESLATHDSDSDGLSGCWHSGSGGCHCSCAHSVALPVTTDMVLAAYPSATPLPPATAGPFLTPHERVMRPPIA